MRAAQSQERSLQLVQECTGGRQAKRLLFVGMGCQADGFRKFAEMKGFREQVWIVDIICHGSPSPRLWKEYAESAEKKYGKITYLTFGLIETVEKAAQIYMLTAGLERKNTIKDEDMIKLAEFFKVDYRKDFLNI